MAIPLDSAGLKPFTQSCERSTVPAKVAERPPTQLEDVLHYGDIPPKNKKVRTEMLPQDRGGGGGGRRRSAGGGGRASR